MSSQLIDTDVLLVGLGPVGAALANLLGGYGLRVLAIDKATAIFEKPRAIALDNDALRILQMVGLQEGELDLVAIPQVVYRSPRFGRIARINSAGVIDGHPALVTFFQPQLEGLLRDKLAQYPQVSLSLGTRLAGWIDDGRGVKARLRTAAGTELLVQARFLVGADGAHSTVRRQLGLGFEGHSFQQDWLIVDALDVPEPIDHVEFSCDPRRPAPRMVAPGGRQRWEFMLRAGEAAAEMERPETVRRLLAPWCDSDRLRIERTAVYRFQARVAERFSKGRCFLVGDAAHVTPPFAGQGLVAGLRDVANLGWKLAAVIQGRAGEALLASYDSERRPHARKIIRLALTLGAIVMPQNRLLALAVHGLLGLLRLLPAGRAVFEDLKIKPQNRFDAGLFWRSPGHSRLGAGGLLPQAWVRPGSGGAPRLSDDLLGRHWALIGFGVDPATLLDAALRQRWAAAGGKLWQWCHRAQAQHLAPAERRIEALDESLLPRRVPLGWVAIVRPDRCVLAEGPASEIDALLRRALDLLDAPPSPSPSAAQTAVA